MGFASPIAGLHKSVKVDRREGVRFRVVHGRPLRANNFSFVLSPHQKGSRTSFIIDNTIDDLEVMCSARSNRELMVMVEVDDARVP